MAIGALEVGRGGLQLGVDIPAPATFIGHEREPAGNCNLFDKLCILPDRPKSVGDGQVGPLQVAEDAGEVVVGLF